MIERARRHLRVVGEDDFSPAASLTSIGSRPRIAAVFNNSTQSEDRASKDAWLDQICERLGQLGDLDDGWDTYGARRIPHATLNFAAIALASLWSERGLPVPLISPMSNQAVMVEWRLNGSEITLEVNRPNDVLVLVEHPSGATDELRITSDFSRITEALEQARPQFAVA